MDTVEADRAPKLTPNQGEAKAAEHTRMRLEKDKERDTAVRKTTDLINKYHLQFLHLRQYEFVVGSSLPALCHKGGMTVAYQIRGSDLREVLITTALVHKRDTYCRWQGKTEAARKFDRGEHISLRLPKNEGPGNFLRKLFMPIVAPILPGSKKRKLK